MDDGNMLTAIAERRNKLADNYTLPKLKPVSYSFIEGIPGYETIAVKLFRPLLVDHRNECFVLYTVSMLATVFFPALLLFRNFWWMGAAAHLVFFFSYVGSYTAILHNTSHKPMYVSRYAALNHIIPYVLGPFFGQTWNTYYYHHVKHHHVQNNGPKDISSTLDYQRDSFFDFVCYFSRFFFLVAYELPRYFWARGQCYEAAVTLGGEISSFLLMYLAYRLNPLAAVTVLIVPFVVVRFGMMSGNWAQHAFIDPTDPDNDFKSSTVCVNHAYNKDAFNDGYHTSHHLNPLRHWSEHPTHMIKDLQRYHAEAPIVLRDIDFMGVWFLLMTKNYDALAERFVHIGPATMPKNEVIDMLKARVKRIC